MFLVILEDNHFLSSSHETTNSSTKWYCRPAPCMNSCPFLVNNPTINHILTLYIWYQKNKWSRLNNKGKNTLKVPRCHLVRFRKWTFSYWLVVVFLLFQFGRFNHNVRLHQDESGLKKSVVGCSKRPSKHHFHGIQIAVLLERCARATKKCIENTSDLKK